jgi:hypothetical protein
MKGVRKFLGLRATSEPAAIPREAKSEPVREFRAPMEVRGDARSAAPAVASKDLYLIKEFSNGPLVIRTHPSRIHSLHSQVST